MATSKPKKPKDHYHHGDLRQALLKAAWKVLTTEGVGALSLRRVASAVGVSHAAPAHHFKDKEALLEALRAEGYRRFADALVAGTEIDDPLRSTGRAYIRFALEHPRQVELMFQKRDTPPTEELQREAGRAFQIFLQAVEARIGPERAADPDEVATVVIGSWAMVHGLAKLFTEIEQPKAMPGKKSAAALRSDALDLFLAGVDGRAPRPRPRPSKSR